MAQLSLEDPTRIYVKHLYSVGDVFLYKFHVFNHSTENVTMLLTKRTERFRCTRISLALENASICMHVTTKV